MTNSCAICTGPASSLNNLTSDRNYGELAWSMCGRGWGWGLGHSVQG